MTTLPAKPSLGIKRATFAATTDQVISEPYTTSIALNGADYNTFVPKSTEVKITVNIAASNAGFARSFLNLLYGVVSPAGELQQASQLSPPKAGVVNLKCGEIGLDAVEGFMTRTFYETGLTPGAVYSFRLQAGPVGGSLNYPIPSASGFGQGDVVLLPDDSKAYVRLASVGDVLVVSPQPSNPISTYFDKPYSFAESAKYRTNLGLSILNFGGACATPDSTKVLFCDVWSGFLRIIETTTDTVLASTTGSALVWPQSVAAQSNTAVWVTKGDGDIQQINPATGATVGSPVVVEAGADPADNLSAIVIDRVNNIAYVGSQNTTSSKVYKIASLGTSNTVTSVTVPQNVNCLALSNDLTKLFVGMQGSAGIRTLNTSDLTTANSAMAPPSGAVTCSSISPSAQGGVIFAGWDNGFFTYHSITAREGANQAYIFVDGIDFGTGNTSIASNTADYIYLSYTEGLAILPGSKLYISPNGGPFFLQQEHAEVIIEGVV